MGTDDGELVTAKVDSDLKCEKGGEFDTALNTDIFFEVWKKVVTGSNYANYDWTVKADPDAVFFPGHLKSVLLQLCAGDCQWGEDMFTDQCLNTVLGVRCEH